MVQYFRLYPADHFFLRFRFLYLRGVRIAENLHFADHRLTVGVRVEWPGEGTPPAAWLGTASAASLRRCSSRSFFAPWYCSSLIRAWKRLKSVLPPPSGFIIIKLLLEASLLRKFYPAALRVYFGLVLGVCIEESARVFAWLASAGIALRRLPAARVGGGVPPYVAWLFEKIGTRFGSGWIRNISSCKPASPL
jgi:hypothetical protein